MELRQLADRLEQLTGEQIPESTIKNWAHTEKIIPTPIGGGKGGRVRGGISRKADWPPESVEQAAAVWWVRETYRKRFGENKKLSKVRINVIKREAARLDKEPFAIYTPPPVRGPLSLQHIDPESIKMTFVNEDCSEVGLFPGLNNAQRTACLNKLIVAWIAAREKVRAWASASMSATYVVEHYPELGHLTPGEVDFSTIDPWKADIPCPWRLDRKARITLHWWSQPSENKGMQFGKMAYPIQRTLSESNHDEIVLFENGVDTRTFFKIDIGDRQSWAKVELEKIDSERERLERKLQRLGMYKIGFNALAIKEMPPIETLTAREKSILEAGRKMIGLSLYRAKLDNFIEKKQ
ncbi:MAG: hypothetical protein ACXV7G_10700 [Halobacteriota archaeon]